MPGPPGCSNLIESCNVWADPCPQDLRGRPGSERRGGHSASRLFTRQRVCLRAVDRGKGIRVFRDHLQRHETVTGIRERDGHRAGVEVEHARGIESVAVQADDRLRRRRSPRRGCARACRTEPSFTATLVKQRFSLGADEVIDSNLNRCLRLRVGRRLRCRRRSPAKSPKWLPSRGPSPRASSGRPILQCAVHRRKHPIFVRTADLGRRRIRNDRSSRFMGACSAAPGDRIAPGAPAAAAPGDPGGASSGAINKGGHMANSGRRITSIQPLDLSAYCAHPVRARPATGQSSRRAASTSITGMPFWIGEASPAPRETSSCRAAS